MSEENLRAINEFLVKERELTLKKDIDGLLELYTEDVILLPPDGDILEGKEALNKFREHQLSLLDYMDLKATTLEVVGKGDVVALRYMYNVKVQRKGQGVTERGGRGVALFKRTPDGLKLHWDVWNSPPAS